MTRGWLVVVTFLRVVPMLPIVKSDAGGSLSHNFHRFQDGKLCHAVVLKGREGQVAGEFRCLSGGQQHVEQIGVVMPHRSSRRIAG